VVTPLPDAPVVPAVPVVPGLPAETEELVIAESVVAAEADVSVAGVKARGGAALGWGRRIAQAAITTMTIPSALIATISETRVRIESSGIGEVMLPQHP
jgi:hypothetical protein